MLKMRVISMHYMHVLKHVKEQIWLLKFSFICNKEKTIITRCGYPREQNFVLKGQISQRSYKALSKMAKR